MTTATEPAVGFPRITVDSKMPVPIPRPPHEAPEFFTFRVLFEYKTQNRQVTSIEVAKSMLSALSDIDDAWADRTKIVEAYQVHVAKGGSATDISPPASKSEGATTV